MPKGCVAPGWVLPICGLGDHQEAARPVRSGSCVSVVPMNGSTHSITMPAPVSPWPHATSALCHPDYGLVTNRATGTFRGC